jgi:tRNA U34 2-thiouridine synthase MnmA/TrmU
VFSVSKIKKGLALVSGGLDSTLAVKAILDQGIEMEAVHFTTPFRSCDKCSVNAIGEEFDIPVHHIFAGQEFLDILVDPPHGYGSQINICIDCRILMLRKAHELGEKIGADFYVTGEVVGQRPFSQRMRAMRLIEREAGLEGKILRPLSAKLLPETDVEREGVVDREALHAIRGRRRLPQMELAKELGVYDYPCPSGGCLLTDPQFARRLRDYLEHEGRPVLEDMVFLRIGRHFRVGEARVIVGRNEGENNRLQSLADGRGISHMSVSGYMGPVTVLLGGLDDEVIGRSAAITARYSDAPRDVQVDVEYHDGAIRILKAVAVSDDELEDMRI